MAKVVIPVGEDGNVEITLTPEQIEAKRLSDLAEAETARLEAERLEAERLALETANKDTSKNTIILEIDGKEVTHTLNEQGDVLKEDGTILYTAAQLKEFEEPEVDLVTKISTLSGIQVLDETGKPKVYTSDPESLAQRESDIRKLGYQEAQQIVLQKYLEANPEFAAMADYKRIYGTLDGFASHVDYSKITLDANNAEQLYDIIYKAELKKGNTADRAKRLADLSKSDNTLLSDAEDSKKYLETLQLADSKAADDRINAIRNAEIDQENQYFGVAYNEQGKEVVLNVAGSIYDMVVAKGEIGDLKIPIDGITIKDDKGTSKTYTRRQIFDYINNPVKEINGEYYTQAQLDEFKRVSDKKEIVSTYIRNLLGGDLSSLITISKLKDKADNVRRIKIGEKSSSKSSESGSKKVIIPIK
jgi:hypothetical protein